MGALLKYNIPVCMYVTNIRVAKVGSRIPCSLAGANPPDQKGHR